MAKRHLYTGHLSLVQATHTHTPVSLIHSAFTTCNKLVTVGPVAVIIVTVGPVAVIIVTVGPVAVIIVTVGPVAVIIVTVGPVAVIIVTVVHIIPLKSLQCMSLQVQYMSLQRKDTHNNK